MPKMSLSVIAVRLPFGVGRERGRFLLRVEVFMDRLEARDADAVNVRPCRSLRGPATECDSMFTRSNFITCRGRPWSVGVRRGRPRQRTKFKSFDRMIAVVEKMACGSSARTCSHTLIEISKYLQQ